MSSRDRSPSRGLHYSSKRNTTRDLLNFKENLPAVKAAIENASFLSIDAEFTGLHMPGVSIHGLDTPESRYQKLRKGAMPFQVLQFGLCTFEFKPDSKSHEARVFNFYVFPRPFSRQATDSRFSCQSSSIDFLSAQGFDFTKAFREGIPYLTKMEEQRLHSALQQKHQMLDANNSRISSPAFSSPLPGGATTDQVSTPNSKSIEISEDMKAFAENIRQQVENFQKSDEELLALEPCSGFMRKITYQTIQQHFPAGIHLQARTNKKKMRYIEVTKVKNESELKDRETAKRQAEHQEIEDAVGFSKVISAICQSGKLVVGHNMLLDLLHTVDKFCCSLPEEYSEFKAMIKSIFPRLLDTKLMACTQPFKELIQNSTLGDLEQTVKEKPFCEPNITFPEDFPSYTNDTDRLHEAGYDAYITGRCFISMANYLEKLSSQCTDDGSCSMTLLQPFINKLYLMRVYDIPYMNLDGDDCNVYITWLDDTSAFVALFKKDQAEHVMRNIKKSETYVIKTYENYMSSVVKQAASTQSQHLLHTAVKRKVPSSDVELPRKRRRSSESPVVSQFANRNIPPIPEEADEDSSVKTNTANGQNTDDLGEAVERPMTNEETISEPAPVQNADDGKLFSEAATWN